jgi:hypothetical protein
MPTGNQLCIFVKTRVQWSFFYDFVMYATCYDADSVVDGRGGVWHPELLLTAESSLDSVPSSRASLGSLASTGSLASIGSPASMLFGTSPGS